jgi:multidrug efflux pump subunit AcrB
MHDPRTPAEINGLITKEEQVQQVAETEVQEAVTEFEEPSEEIVQPLKTESESDKNFRILREEKKKLERERDEYLKLLQQTYAQKNAPAVQAPVEDEDTDLNIAPDEIVEGKHIAKVLNRQRQLENELKQYKQQAASMNVQTQIRMQYPDYASVVTEQNIEILRTQHPEIAQALGASTDPYSTALSAYKLIKKLGIAEDVPDYLEEKLRVQKNSAKPRPLASVSPQHGESPLTKANAFANGLTDELKKQLHREMMLARK